MENSVVLLLTATVNTNNKSFTQLHNKEQRLSQYIETIKYYLALYEQPLVFVENSGEDLSLFRSRN